MPAPTYINIEYFFYKTFLFLKETNFFIRDIDWFNVIFWSKTISIIISAFFVAGIVYNIRGIIRAFKKKREEEL